MSGQNPDTSEMRREIRAFTAVPGASAEATPFAGKANVAFNGTAWTNDIRHGDIVRNDPAETMPVDACNLQFVYQGFDKTVHVSDYGLIPYRMALLTLRYSIAARSALA